MNAWSVDYDANLDHPALVELCTHCRYPKCDGICTDYKNKLREINGIKKITRRPKQERVAEPSLDGTYDAFGETHTLREWAAIYGMRYKTLYERIRRSGMPIEEALTRPLQKASIPTMYTVDGETRTIHEWSAATGIPVNTIYSRLARGWTPAQAVGREPHVFQ